MHSLTIILFLFGQGEMQQLRDKLAIADRAAKSEAQMKVRILVGMHIDLVFFMSLCMKALISCFLPFSGEISTAA